LDESKESEEDKSESNKESVMKKEVKETKKVVKEEAGKKGGDAFTEKPKLPDMLEEEREKDFVGDIENDTPNQGKGEAEDGDAFLDKVKGPSSGTPMPNLKEEFDITELDMNSVDSALDNAGEEDEVLTMEQIEEEIASMESIGDELAEDKSMDGGVAYNQLVTMRNQLDEMINGLGVSEQKNHGGQGANKVNDGGPTTAMIDEEQVEEQKNHGGQGANRVNDGGPTTAMIDEEEITDADIEAVLGSGGEEPVDEAMGISISAGTITPGKLGDHEGTHGRFRNQGVDESKKLGSLIKENKELTKRVNETKKYKQSVSTLLENYKTALEKYRNQLKEMAIFNTNLAHVNNLLVNESLALTQDDKIKIINEFKKS
jgi:hypothetical protein